MFSLSAILNFSIQIELKKQSGINYHHTEILNTKKLHSFSPRQVERPVVDGNQYDGVCACLRDYPGFVDFLSCPSSTPFIQRVVFTRCEDNNFIPIGVDCLRF